MLFFDIETGGFSGTRNPLLSISWAGKTGDVQSRYAAPAKGAYLSRWAENRVWKPIKNQNLVGEKIILMDFLNVLENAPQNTQLVGWNIGYSTSKGAGGFDVKMLIERAKQHSLEQRYRKALKRMQIRDIGSEWALKIARGVASETGERLVKEGVLHEDLYQEAVGFMKQVGRLRHEWGIKSDQDLAEAISRENIRFSGWKQELVHEVFTGKKLIGAHQSSEDVAALRKLIVGEVDEKFIRRWAPRALENKLVSRAKFAPMDIAEAIPGRFQGIMQEAEKWGLKEGVEQRLRNLAVESGVSFSTVQAGLGIPQKERMIRESVLPDLAEKFGKKSLAEGLDLTLSFASRHWGKIALGVGAGALLAIEPGNLFSGRDDEYNVIEGLRHGGEAERMRKAMTAFGSGARRFFGLLAKTTGRGTEKEGLSLLRGGMAAREVEAATALFAKKEGVQTFFGPRAAGKLEGAVFGTSTFGLQKQLAYDADAVVRASLDAGLSPAQAELLKPVALGHEMSEVFHGTRQITKNIAKREARGELVTEASAFATTGSHISSAVVADEFLIAASMGKETWQAAKQFRLAEAKRIEEVGGDLLAGASGFFKKKRGVKALEEFKKKMDPDYVIKSEKDLRKSNLEYARKLRKMISSFEQKQLPKFQAWQTPPPLPAAPPPLPKRMTPPPLPKKIDTTPGLGASIGRKKTDFGSPVDLNKATMRAQSMYGKEPVAGKMKSGILEPRDRKVARQVKMQSWHKKAQVTISRNALRPGKRHRQQTGRLVT